MKPPRRFLALGDSYTVGEAVEPAESWPHQLAHMLGERGVYLETTVIARTGWTVRELLEAASAAELPPSPALVTLLIGVNDQYRGVLVENFAADFARMLAFAKTISPMSRLLVLSIPDWGVTPFAGERDRRAIAAAIDTFNSEALRQTRQAGASWLDVTPISREAATDGTLIARDGLHLSPAAHRRIAEAALPVAEEILQGGPEGFPRRGGS